ncbi:MAG TPA: alpha-glucosidase/alpha-galactosidase [Planctomycetota bacterium]|nr:alpha-glucosidase/alpha-galactosidase [Planctomycetota bacterium]HRR79320.1 alpha-glucosidase/alpha-galactosidase [Planctomycetota bacterium]
MAKIAFIGAGSLGFSRRLMIDLLNCPALRDTEFALMDVDAVRLGYMDRIASRIIGEMNVPARHFVTTNRRKALEGADFVITMILVAGIDVFQHDINVPLKYGVDQCIGDSYGVGGVFRALRTIPVMADIARDMADLCPDALLLNYTNPMSMLMWGVNAAVPDLQTVGLCHSVQGTAHQIARWIGVPPEEVDYWVAGINHQAWFLELTRKGKDLYPRLRKVLDNPEVVQKETCRFELFRHFGYFVTESSGHNSEYIPWIRKRPELIEKYCPGGGWNGGTAFILELYGANRKDYKKGLARMAEGKDPINYNRSHEYGSYIIDAVTTGQTFRFNGNVPNDGLITNLLPGCCVEVPCYADRHGVNPAFVGDLPAQLAAINQAHVAVCELTVQAALTGDRDAVYQACALDPLTGAVCSLDEVRSMCDELFEASAAWLPTFKARRKARQTRRGRK